jgi:predicted O-linked N-acetylglucosamine transferase (SPINDLY family)
MNNQENVNEISKIISTDTNIYNVYNLIKSNYDENKIDNEIYIKLINRFVYTSHVFDTRVHEILINYFKKKFNTEELTDDILFKNIKNNSLIEMLLIVFLLIKPKILLNSKLENINHNVRVHKNLDKLLCEKCLYNIITSVDDFYNTVIVNYNYYHVYNGLNNKILYNKISKLFRLICPGLTFTHIQKPLELTNQTNQDNKIKIGFLCDILLSDTSVCNDRIGIIASLIKDTKYQVYIFTKSAIEGQLYKAIINSIEFKNKIMLTESIIESRTTILKYNIDILVYPEIGMDPFYYYLAYSRLAPIQINTWGHSETSGIDTIDYYFSSKYYEIPDAQKFYSEKLVCLDSLCTYYYSLKLYDFYLNLDKTTQNDNLLYFNLPSNCNIYGIFQTVFKYEYNIIEIIKNILYQDPKAIIIILTYNKIEEAFLNFLNNNLSYHINRVRILKRYKLEKYCKLIKCVDVILDSYPFGGCNTSLQAFSLGKVVVTLPGDKLSSRFTYGFYQKMDITEPICTSIKDYVDKSIYYANNKTELRKIEEKIIQNRHKIFEENDSIITWKNKLEELYNNQRDICISKPNIDIIV